MFVVRRTGVGRLRKVVEVCGKRIDEGFQTTALVVNASAQVFEPDVAAIEVGSVAIGVAAQHVAIVAEHHTPSRPHAQEDAVASNSTISSGNARRETPSIVLGGITPAPPRRWAISP